MTKIKKFFSLSIILVFFGFSCPKKPKHDQENINPQVHVKSSYDAKNNLLVVRVEISNGFYAYAPGEKIGKPVSLEITQKNGWDIASPPEIPPGAPKEVFANEMSLILAGNFDIKQKLKPGSGPGEGLLLLQICAKDICHKPEQHKIVWTP